MIEDLYTTCRELFADGVQTVLRGHENRNRTVVMLKGNLVQNVRTDTRGVNARVNKNGAFGFASIAEYTPEAAGKVIKAATENALFLDGQIQKLGRVRENCDPQDFMRPSITEYIQ